MRLRTTPRVRMCYGEGMAIRITYRRTGGVCALLMFAVVALAATTLAAAVTAALLIGAVTIGTLALLVRALWPGSWRRRPVPLPRPWRGQTIDVTPVHPTRSSDGERLSRMDSDKG